MNYVLNLQPTFNVELILNCSQYDTTYRVFNLELYDGLDLYEIPEDAVISVRGTKPDETIFDTTLTGEGSIVNFPLEDYMTVVPGIVQCELRVTKFGEIIGSANFVLDVEPTSLDEEAVSETQLPLLEEAIQEAEYIKSITNHIKASVERNEEGALVKVQDLHGETEAQLYDGEKGEQGEKGDKGDKGEDGLGLDAYWSNDVLYIRTLENAEEVEW